MTTHLTENECRVIGVLLEKSITTPDQYPLSINALTNGCNQKSNRDPVTQFSEDDVKRIVEDLKDKRLVQLTTGFGSRVDKLQHRFCNTEFGDLKLSEQQLAVVTELLLRGPQTPGELRGRCQRLAHFSDMADIEATLASLQAYQPDALVRQLAREPGKREARYQHCFTESGGNNAPIVNDTVHTPVQRAEPRTELAALQAQVAELTTTLQSVLARLDALEQKD